MKNKFIIFLVVGLLGLVCAIGLSGCSAHRHYSNNHHRHGYNSRYHGGKHHGGVGKHGVKHGGKNHNHNKNRKSCDCPRGF
jgi:hypothetical protein